MATIETLFVTRLYGARLGGRGAGLLNDELAKACRAIAREDRAGQAWCRDNGYQGYTSYASLDDLVWRSPAFADLAGRLDPHVAAFARAADLDLERRKLALDSIWINILASGGAHSGHIHPHSVVSGTYYVEVPKGASALKLEDPRLPLMMAAPPRRQRARRDNQSFVYLEPAPGSLFLWESWLRHEVPVNRARRSRISISFNYGLR
jgi:uncharacterized protein (TIGR02466 family)